MSESESKMTLERKVCKQLLTPLLEHGSQMNILEAIKAVSALPDGLTSPKIGIQNECLLRAVVGISICHFVFQFGGIVYGGFLRDILSGNSNFNDIDIFWENKHAMNLFFALFVKNITKYLQILNEDVDLQVTNRSHTGGYAMTTYLVKFWINGFELSISIDNSGKRSQNLFHPVSVGSSLCFDGVKYTVKNEYDKIKAFPPETILSLLQNGEDILLRVDSFMYFNYPLNTQKLYKHYIEKRSSDIEKMFNVKRVLGMNFFETEGEVTTHTTQD